MEKQGRDPDGGTDSDDAVQHKVRVVFTGDLDKHATPAFRVELHHLWPWIPLLEGRLVVWGKLPLAQVATIVATLQTVCCLIPSGTCSMAKKLIHHFTVPP